MDRPTFSWDPTTLREVPADVDAAREYANALLARYRDLADQREQRAQIVAELIQWLRMSEQYMRAEEIARGSLRLRGGDDIITALEEGRPVPVIAPELIRPALRFATALQWNSADSAERFGQAADLFDACVTSAHIVCLRSGDAQRRDMYETYAFTLQHRAKFRLANDELIAALRDANLGLRVREVEELPRDQIESSQFAVSSIVQRLESLIADLELSAGASVTTETFAAGDRSGVGAVQAGQRIGPWLFWHKSGALKAAGWYVDDQLDGPWIWFRDHGLLLQEGSFIHNRQEGPWIRYYTNGRILDQGTFHDGEKVGDWFTFHEDGSVRSTRRHTRKGRWLRR